MRIVGRSQEIPYCLNVLGCFPILWQLFIFCFVGTAPCGIIHWPRDSTSRTIILHLLDLGNNRCIFGASRTSSRRFSAVPLCQSIPRCRPTTLVRSHQGKPKGHHSLYAWTTMGNWQHQRASQETRITSITSEILSLGCLSHVLAFCNTLNSDWFAEHPRNPKRVKHLLR